MPPRTRTTIMERSNSANTPIILKRRLAGRRGGVDPLLVQIQIDPQGVNLAQETDQILQAAAQARSWRHADKGRR